MKNKLAILFFLLLISYLSFAQKGFRGALYVGPLTSQVDGDNHGGYSKFGINAGVSTNFYISDLWSFNTEMSYIQKGSVFNDAKNNVYYRLKLNYIEIPFYITYKTLKYKKLKKMSFDLGASLGYLFNAKEDKNGYGYLDPEPEMKSFDINVLAAVNYHFNENWKISVRFQYSIMPIRKVKANPYKEIFNRGQYNNLFALNFYRYF